MGSSGFSLRGLLLLQSMGSKGAWASVVVAKGSVIVAHGLSCPMAWEFPQTRDQTYVPLHWQEDSFFFFFFIYFY